MTEELLNLINRSGSSAHVVVDSKPVVVVYSRESGTPVVFMMGRDRVEEFHLARVMPLTHD